MNEFKIKNGLVVDAGGINTTGSVNVSGSLSVGVGGITEFQVLSTGVAIGNSITDIHSITGSVQISGSLNATSSVAVSASYALSASFSTSAQSAATASYIVLAQSASYVLNAVSASYATSALTASHALTSPYSGLQGTVPTWNQNTTGTAATASYVAGANVAGNIAGNAATATQTITTVTGTNSAELVRGNMADNDQFRILVGGTATNAGYVEIATADDGTEPIHVRQYTGVFTTLARTATLLDGSGNTTFPGSVTATSFFESSDKNIKTLIADNYQAKGIESVMSRLYYKNGKQELGYFAQDVQAILPSAVSIGDDGLLNLSYREVHTAKIAQLEQRILELERQLNLA
jgi:hypothetical protein